MKIQNKELKKLKKFDDTAKSNKKGMTKHITKNSSKKSQDNKRKLTPGQTLLRFYYNIKQEQKEIQINCYDEKFLNWPVQLTQKLQSHQLQNDQDSDDQVIAHQIKKGFQELSQEITFKKIAQMEDTIGF